MQIPEANIESGLRNALMYSNVHIAFVAVCFLAGTYAVLELPLSIPLLVAAGSGAFLIYQLDRAFLSSPEDALNNAERQAWVASHKRYVWSSALIAVLLVGASLPGIRLHTLIGGLLLALVGGSYMLPLLPQRRRLKGIGSLKPIVIGGVWAVGGVVLPLLEAGESLSLGVVAFLGYRFLFLLSNAFLADWPDRTGDESVGVRTVATRLSARQLQGLCITTLAMAIGMGTVSFYLLEAPLLSYVDLGGPVLFMLVVFRPWPISRWFYNFVIDMIIAWPGVTACTIWLWT